MNLKELAKTLGLSQTTVSRALNGYPEVSARTRERVARAAKLHGYRPNRRARSLATGRSRRIAIVAGAGDGQGLKDPIFCAFLSGAAEILERHSYDWVIRQPKVGQGQSQLSELAEEDSLEGAILTEPLQADRSFAAKSRRRFPVVVRGQFSGRGSTVDGVDYDHRLAMQSAVTSLARAGFCRIALVTGLRDRLLTQTQTSAFLSAVQTSGLQVSPGLVLSGPDTHHFGLGLLDQFGLPEAYPVALIIGSSLVASGVSEALTRLGSNGPNDMRYVFFDEGLSWLDASESMHCFARLSTPVDVLGRVAATRLLQRISDPDARPDTRILAPAFFPCGAVAGDFQAVHTPVTHTAEPEQRVPS
jgi:LacI family transcriptional regulator